MVKATKGLFLRTEPSVKEVILKINEQDNFIIEDINDESIFIKDIPIEPLRKRVELITSYTILKK